MSWFTNTFPQANNFGIPLFIPARPGRNLNIPNNLFNNRVQNTNHYNATIQNRTNDGYFNQGFRDLGEFNNNNRDTYNSINSRTDNYNSNKDNYNSNRDNYQNNNNNSQFINYDNRNNELPNRDDNNRYDNRYDQNSNNTPDLDDVFNDSIDQAIKNLDRDLKNDYNKEFTNNLKNRYDSQNNYNRDWQKKDYINNNKGNDNSYSHSNLNLNIDNFYNKSIDSQEKNNNQNCSQPSNQNCNIYYNSRQTNTQCPNLEIPSNSCLKKEMEPPNLDIPCLQESKGHNFSMKTMSNQCHQNGLNITKEIEEIKETLHKKSSSGKIFSNKGEEELSLNFRGNLCGVPCQPRQPCQQINLYNPCCRVPTFTTKFFINQTLLQCASLDLCQFIRVQVKKLNCEENEGINNSVLLDFCTDIFDLGCFKTACLVDSIEIVIDGFVPSEGMTSSYKQFITIDKESYRLKIWPPPNCTVRHQSIYIIITIQTCSECERIWTLNLISFEDNMCPMESACSNKEPNPCAPIVPCEPCNPSVCKPPPNFTPIPTSCNIECDQAEIFPSCIAQPCPVNNQVINQCSNIQQPGQMLC